MKITNVGAGAIGASLGAWMGKGGEKVTFVDVWKAYVVALKNGRWE